MANLRIISVVVVDSSNITATFTATLSEDIDVGNILLISQTTGVADGTVLFVNVVGNTLQIQTQPLIPFAAYYITFQSTSTVLFQSLNGNAVLPTDGVSNRYLILGPISPDNPIQNYFNSFFQNNVYDLAPPSQVSTYLAGLSSVLSTALYAIGQAASDNYLSLTITDEIKTRGQGPYDRLNQGGAYEVLRVGTNPTGAIASFLTQYASFPSYQVSIQATPNTENLQPSNATAIGTFNLNTLTLTLSKQFVIILTSATFIYSSQQPYVYNIDGYGYQILNSEYDPDYAFTYLQLNNNQIILNSQILNDPNFSTENILYVQVAYQFQDTGKVIDPATFTIDTVLTSSREVVPPIENIFTLQHAPIVVSTDVLGTVGDVDFIDPNALPGSNTSHPAFLYEVPYRLDYMPSNPGEYAVDYSNGNVYVFGATSTQDGTGPYPPLATYSYRYVFQSLVDYVLDIDTLDLVALPLGSMIGAATNITYNYEQVLSQGIDYMADVHIESLNEAIDNRLVALNAVQPLNFPITNAFRMFNQTTGEIYTITRWSNNQIYFNYNTAPNIEDITYERASFQNILNNTLFVSATTTISPSKQIFQIFLSDNNIISGTQDCIGSSINTSVSFSNPNMFSQEIYFDNTTTIAENNARLTNIGDYQIDYVNGIIWLLTSSTQSFAIGTISYKRGYIVPVNANIITVDDIYYEITALTQKLKHFTYVDFTANTILPSTFDVSNEGFLNGNIEYPYIVDNNQIGTLINASFVPGITSTINFVRGIFVHDDLINNIEPLNFAPTSTSSGNIITTNPLSYQEYHTVQYNGTNYYIQLNTDLLYLSPDITLAIQVQRLTDNAQLWSVPGTVVLGSPITLILSGIHSPAAGNTVLVSYSYTINPGNNVVVDYDRGGYYIDYTYLYDQILISYEYGDNVLDFSQSTALSPGDTYYVSYLAGALRDSLLANFGTLVNIPILNSLDVNFERERYRDALMAALQSFTQGPTVASISNIVSKIVHTPPQIIESAFQGWYLGSSILNPEPISTTGTFSLVPAKYDFGVVVNQPNQTITFPIASNLCLEQGTLETWIIPEWNGLDNQANITLTITKNGNPLPPEMIFIGPGAYHPTYSYNNNTITLNTQDNVLGVPNESKTGVFIYYTKDISGDFNRWYIDVLDGYNDGYTIKSYSITIKTNGRFYDVKSTDISQPSYAQIFSGTNSLTFIASSSQIATGITFLADNQHFIFDFGESANCNRFSLFKDEGGYINFRVIDKHNITYVVSTDISDWQAGQKHQVAIAWALGTKNISDEMHLFIDGLEVSNIIRYGNKVSSYLHENFRTVDPEEMAGIITKNIVGSSDMTTTAGSDLVSSFIDFNAAGIHNGDTLFIEESGFDPSGYTITSVGGQVLTLAADMPLTMQDATFSVNKTSIDLFTEISIYPNIIVQLLHVALKLDGVSQISGSDLQVIVDIDTVSSASINFTTEKVLPGYLIRIAEAGFAITYTIVAVSGNTLTLSDDMPISYTNATFYVYANDPIEIPGVRALIPAYEIIPDGNFTYTGASDSNFQGYSTDVLAIKNLALANDIVLVETLGLNNRSVDQKYYVWSGVQNGTLDGYVNIIKTRLPPPIDLDDIVITHILLDKTNIGPNNSIPSGPIYTSDQIITDQPSVSDYGRTLQVNIYGENINFTVPVEVVINGGANGTPISEVVSFDQFATTNTINRYTYVNYIQVICYPINDTQNFLVVSLSEANPITVPENDSTNYPVIRYSYQVNVGNTLTGTGINIVSDTNNFFSSTDVGNYLIISSPVGAAGQYQITAVSEDHTSITLSTVVPTTFSNGKYQVINPTTFRSGLQNGFFTFENAGQQVGTPYYLVQGLYEFEYYTYLSVPLEVGILDGYYGSDIYGNNQVNATLDELQILSTQLTDTRIGETSTANQETITKDYNSLVALLPNINTLVLCHFDYLPFTNAASIYNIATDQFIQSSYSVNANFDQSIVFKDNPYIVDNTGILTTSQQGTIEFWVSPMYDTVNDPNYRFYFDASAMVSQEVVSIDNATVQVSGRVSQVLNVKLQVGDQNIDYFAGGVIAPDMQTLYLNKALPNQNTPVVVNYIPTGVQGDRISIYKDPAGYINFDVRASGVDYVVRSPTYWAKNTWHRLKASFIVNRGIGIDGLEFFVDGYERGNVLFGNGLLFGQNQVSGSTFVGPNDIVAAISFKDTINQLFIGSDYTQTYGAYALIDNLRISNISRPLFQPFGEPIDVNYSPNLNTVFPVSPDLYTTLLLDFNSLVSLNTSYSTLVNRMTGLFDFTVNISDSFDILANNPISQSVLITLLNTLKPANSVAYIRYEDQ